MFRSAQHDSAVMSSTDAEAVFRERFGLLEFGVLVIRSADAATKNRGLFLIHLKKEVDLFSRIA